MNSQWSDGGLAVGVTGGVGSWEISKTNTLDNWLGNSGDGWKSNSVESAVSWGGQSVVASGSNTGSTAIVVGGSGDRDQSGGSDKFHGDF